LERIVASRRNSSKAGGGIEGFRHDLGRLRGIVISEHNLGRLGGIVVFRCNLGKLEEGIVSSGHRSASASCIIRLLDIVFGSSSYVAFLFDFDFS
jgi:hypothetical protein